LRRGLHRSILAAVRSLPGQLTSFVGRAPALEAVSHLMGEHRLVSVVGPGGCGKTRLAIEVSQRGAVALKSFCFVDLSGLSDPELVPVAALTALGLTEAPGASPLETLVALLAERELVVILDNCEHLIAACAALVVALISHCPGLRLLATSRERLGVTGEAVVDLGGLELPGPGGRDEAWLLRSEAGRLFVERARTARAGFGLKGDDAVIVASICEHLDGIPLALEMAATRVRMLSVQAIAEGLSDRFKLLSGDTSAGAARQRSLLASVQWSCGLLVQAERQVLHRLSVFASGFTVAAAETVCTGGEVAADQVFSLLSSLVEKSLVQASPEVDRLRLHETMRAYAASALEAEGATSAVRDRHLDYFATLARCWEPKMVTSEFLVARGKLEPELDNLRSALDWSVESEQFATGAAFLSSLGSFYWEQVGFNSEAVARCETFLSADIEPSLRGDLLYLASRCSRLMDPAKSQRLAWELLCLGRSLGDQRMEAGGLVASAVMSWMRSRQPR
jgi:predicted ATPase